MAPLDELKEILKWHAWREPLNTWFTRQLHERVAGHRLEAPKAKWAHVRLAAHAVQVVEEQWPLERLARFQFHDRDQPTKDDVALVVFRGWGQECLIDGQTRVNLWRKRTDAGPHRVLVVQPNFTVTTPFPADG